MNFGQPAAEIGSLVWGIPANFNWFRVLASSLQRRQSTEANQTLHDVWLSRGLGDVYKRQVIAQTIFMLWFVLLLLLSFFFFSSPNLSGRRLDVYRTLAHGVALVRI